MHLPPDADWLARPAVMSGPDWHAVELTPADAPQLQRFLEGNPGYSRIVSGREWQPGDALRELTELPPPDWPQGATRHLIALREHQPCALLVFTENLLATGVWHLGLFLVDEGLHGSGLAAQLHAGFERHAREHGAQWLRLGVVERNERARRFWRRCGYETLRQRDGIAIGLLGHRLDVMVKALGPSSREDYWSQVPRDRPET